MINLTVMEVRLGQDPVLRYTTGGTAVCNLSGANNTKYKDVEYTNWFPIVCWRNLAEIASKFLKKSSHINVVGSLATRDWVDQQGNKRYITEIRANEISFLDKKTGETVQAKDEGASQESTSQENAPLNDGPDDDIPF